MGPVILAALCVAAFAVLFKFFARHEVPLFPAITVNYLVAFLCGLAIHPPWMVGDISVLWAPAAGLGALFVTVFSLTGLSAQRAGAARTTLAGRMSLVLTVLGTVWIFHERIGPIAWVGIGIALVGLALATRSAERVEGGRSWILPVLIFLGSGACDIGVNAAQRTHTTSLNEGAFTTMCFGATALVSTLVLFARGQYRALANGRTWFGGIALGVVNYASLLLLIIALGEGALPASSIFPLMNIAAILFGTVAAILLFRERLSVKQWVGITLCVAALVLLMLPRP